LSIQGFFAAGCIRAGAVPRGRCRQCAAIAFFIADLLGRQPAVKWETGLLFTGVTVFGLRHWNSGSSHSFHSTAEGWFGLNTENGGADKLGHAFSAYLITNDLAEQLLRQGRSPEQAALTSALITQALLTYVEIYDGYSVNHGWSKEDLVMNVMGSGAAYLRQVTPGLRDKLDFRLEYQPSGYKGFSPITDYACQKYVLAVKLSGFSGLRDTPWRHVELQTGYYASGFSRNEQLEGMVPSRHGFIGIGLNLSELLFGQRTSHETGARRGERLFFEHIQLPHTVARSD
jgi:hypothetical protein